MGTDPRGRADGEFTNLPGYGIGAGLQTPFGIQIPPSGRVLYVRSTGVQTGDTPEIAKRLLPTLAAALSRCRSGLGDTIICLPGHSESVTDNTMLTNLVAGTRIRGVGFGAMMPVFRWTAAGSQWVMNKADVDIRGLRLRLEGAAVTKAIAITGASNSLIENDIEIGSTVTTNVAAIAVEVGTGADACVIAKNRFRSTATSASTDCVLISGTAVDRVSVVDNVMMASTTTTNGLIRCTAAATNLLIARNMIYNSIASSVAGINFSNVAATGVCADNYITVLSTGAVSAGVTGITVGGTNNLVGFFNNLSVNDPNKSGLLTPAVDT